MSQNVSRSAGASKVECPTCYRSDFESQGGMMRHHAITHGEKLREVKVCPQCLEQFEVYGHDADRRVFCSRSCRATKGAMKTMDCLECGKEFSYYRGREDRMFCSKDCHSKSMQSERVRICCDYCGSSFEVLPSEVNSRKYCSEECFSQRQSERMLNLKPEESPAWMGGIHSSTVYEAVRDQLLSGADTWRRLRNDVVGESCRVCGETEKLEVHHVIPLLAGGMNGRWNLMTLCENCHRRVESHTRKVVRRPILEMVREEVGGL